jgi:hypothetical protein
MTPSDVYWRVEPNGIRVGSYRDFMITIGPLQGTALWHGQVGFRGHVVAVVTRPSRGEAEWSCLEEVGRLEPDGSVATLPADGVTLQVVGL